MSILIVWFLTSANGYACSVFAIATTKNVRNGKAIGRSAKTSKNVVRAGKVSVRKRKRGSEDRAGVVVSPAKKRKIATNEKDIGNIGNQIIDTTSGPVYPSANRECLSDRSPNPLLHAFSDEGLQSAIEALASHVSNAARARDQTEAGSVISEMRVLLERDDIRTVWTLKSKMEARRSSLVVDNAVSRAQLLTLCCAAWAWLDSTIDDAYQSMLSGSSHWMKALAIKVDSLVVSGNGADLDESEFFPASPDRRRIYKFKPIAMSRRKSSFVNFRFAIRPILMSWFKFPVSPVEYARSVLLKKIVCSFGVGALYLPTVWTIYEQLPKMIDPAHRKPTKRSTDAWLASALKSVDDATRDDAQMSLQVLTDAISATCVGAIDHRAWDRLVGTGTAMSGSSSETVRCGEGIGMNGPRFSTVPLPSLNDIGTSVDHFFRDKDSEE